MADADRGWRHFEHRADIGVEGWGPTLAEAYAQAALAMTAVVCELERIAPAQAVQIACSEPDPELLLVDWLNALVYEMASRRMLFARFAVELRDGELRATAWGEPVDPVRHQPTVEIKGATYTELAVRQTAKAWRARCVVDV